MTLLSYYTFSDKFHIDDNPAKADRSGQHEAEEGWRKAEDEMENVQEGR